MGVRALQPDEEITPIGGDAPKPAGRPVKAVRPLSNADAFVPLGQTQPNVLPAHTPSIAETIFGRTDPTGTANVEGIVPSMGHDVLNTGKEIGQLFMRGGAEAGGMLQQLAVATQAPPGEATDRALAQVREANRSAEEFWTPKPEDTTPAGDVLGGLAEIALPLMLGGGSPIPLAATTTMHTAEELSDKGVDLETARAVAAIRGLGTYVGAKLPILGKTLPSRVLTGAVGNTVLSTAEQGAEKGALEATNNQGRYKELADEIHPLDPKQKAIDLLIGAAFGGMHHAAAAPHDAARAAYERQLGEDQILDMVDRGGGAAMRPPPEPEAPRNPAADFYEGFTQEGQETPRLHSPEAFERRNDVAPPEPPPPNDGTLPKRGEVTRNGPLGDRAPIEQEIELERMGLTPDVIGNLIKLEDEADNRRAGRVLPAPETPAPPVPDEAAQAAQREQFGKEAQAERTGKIAAERRGEIGLTPDVQANLERMRSRGAVGASVPPPIGDMLAPKQSVTPAGPATADQGVSTPEAPKTTVQTPKVRPLKAGEAVIPVEHVTPGEKGIERKRGNKAVRKYLSTKRPDPAKHDELVMYRTEATLGHNNAVEKGAPADVVAFLRSEAEWAHGELAKRSPDTLTSLGVDAQGRDVRGSSPVKTGGKTAKSAKPQSVLEHLAEHGGLSIDALEKEGIDRADMRSVKGFKRPFTKKGMSLDAAAEKLHEAGYPVADEAGRPDANKALDLITNEVRGKKTYARSAELEGEQTPVEKRTGVEARAGAERRTPPPRETPDRRGDVGERRKPVGEMSHEEMRSELLTSHLTGLPNRRAYDERPRQPHQGSIDVDSLKWVNDNMGHGSGDELLKAVGQALKEAAGDRAYHFSGDEFAIEGADAAELHDVMERVNERLAKATIEVTKADGSVVTLDGLGVSYGLGESLDAADQNLSVAKQTRETQGVRAPRGEKPVGATVRGGGDEGGPDNAGDTAAGVKEPDGGYEPGSEPRAAEPGDVEHVTLTGEGHVSHVTRGEGEHVEVGEHPPGWKEVEGTKRPQRLAPAQGDLFTKADARPGSTEKQIANANKLLKELEEAAEADDEQDIKSLAVSFNHEFRTDHTASLVGKTINSTGDLATLSEVFRNPRFETLRYFMVNREGRIIAQTGVSSRLPSSGAAYPTDESIEWVRKFVDKHPGARLYMQHNHPSGLAIPSAADIALTANIAKKFDISVHHIVIDHDHYGRMIAAPGGRIVSNEKIAITAKMGHPDPLHTPSKPHSILGREVRGPKTFVEIGKELGHKSGFVTVIGSSGSSMKVRTLAEMPAHLLNNPERLKQQLRRYAVQNGNSRLFLAGVDPELFRSSESRKMLNALQNDGYILDAVSTEGHSYIESGGGNQIGGGIIEVSGKEYGVGAHDVAREVKPRESDYEKEQRELGRKDADKALARAKGEEQPDLLGDDVEAKNKAAAAARAKDEKRSPNKEVPADTGRPGDLFTRHKQLDLVKDLVPYEKLLQRRADNIVEKITKAISAGGGDVQAKTVMPLVKQLKKAHAELADLHYGERLARNHRFLEAAERGGDKERAEKIYDKLYDLAEKYQAAGGEDVLKHAPSLADDFPPRNKHLQDDLIDALRAAHNSLTEGGDKIEEPTPEETDAYVAKHKTGNIPSDAYERHNKDLSWIGTKEKYGELVKTVELGGKEYEFRKTGELNRYTKLDENDEIVRGPGGRAEMMTPEEVKAAGYATHDQTIAVFDGDKAIAFASNEFGTTGIFVQESHQRRGIGKELLATFRKENPKLKLGQMTPAGEALVRKAHGEGLIEESRGRYGEERRKVDDRRDDRGGGRREEDEPESQKHDKGYAAVAQKAIDAWNKKAGWRYGPLGRLPAKKQYLEKRYEALGKLGEGQEIARKLYDGLRQATPEDSKAIYEYLTNKDGDLSTIRDPEMRKIAATTKRTIDLIGQRLVNAGLLSQEAYDEHAGEYLPRLYLKYMLGDDVMRAIGSGKRMSDLGYLKKRKDIDEYTRKVILGEITDPAFLASFGISRTLRDLALHDFLRAIAGREQWTPRHSTVEWRGRLVTPFYLADEARALRKRAALYPDGAEKAAAFKLADEAQKIADEGLAKLEARPDPNDFEQIPNSRRYGALRGMYVRKEIYGDLVGAQQWIPANSSVAEQLLGSGGIAARAQSWWKLSKVILNPPTQVRNFIANMVLLHLSGVPFHRVYSGEIIGKAINSIAKKDRYYQIAKKYGLFSATFANSEGARIKDEWLALQDMKGGGLAKLRAFAGRGVNAASDFYQLMEAISKIAKIRDAIEREGKKPADAVLEAHEALFDYSLVPRSVQYLRNAPVGAPFITFAYKSAAQMAKIAIKHPARFAPYVAIPFLMAALIKNAYDVTDDDLKKLRKALPAWMKERGHMLLLPYKDALGRWQVVDLGYLAPWGQFADLEAAAEQGKGAKELAGSLVFSGPMMDVANAIQTGVDPFTGKEIVNPQDAPADRLQQMMQYAWNLAAPGWLTEQGALNQLRKAATGTNLNKRTGEPGMTPTQASLRLLGLNVYPADPTATRAANLRSMRANLEESKARASELLRNKNLSDDEREKIRGVWAKLLEARGKEIEMYSRDSEINPKLQ